MRIRTCETKRCMVEAHRSRALPASAKEARCLAGMFHFFADLRHSYSERVNFLNISERGKQNYSISDGITSLTGGKNSVK